MKISLDHPSAVSANRAEKKKQHWEIVSQSWKVQAEVKGRYIPSLCAFLEYAARCYIPVSYANVEWKEKSRILLAVAIPATYRQLAAALSVSEATASKIISIMKQAGCKYESQLLLMPAVNKDLYEVLDDELTGAAREGRKGIGQVFGGGKKSRKPEDGSVEPAVVHRVSGGSEETAQASESLLGDESEGEEEGEQEAGDRIARRREIGEGGVTILF